MASVLEAGMGGRDAVSLAVALAPRWQGFATSLLAVAWACVPSVPPAELAEARPEYRTQAFTVRAPAGRWVTDSVAIARGLDPGDCVHLQRNRPAYNSILGAPLGQVRFLQLRGFVLDLFGVGVSDAEACVRIAAWELAEPYKAQDVDSVVAKVRGYGLVDTVVQGRVFHEVWPTLSRNDRELLYFTTTRVFRFEFLGYRMDPFDSRWLIVLTSFTPLE